VTTLVVFVALLVVSAVVAASVVVRTNKRRFAEANVVVPGRPTRAPAAWAGAHTPEARLHRRLRDAVAGMQANPAMEDAWMLDARVSLEQRALDIDDRLVAVAALPERVRADALESVSSAVEALEAAVASMVAGASQGAGRLAVEEAMDEVEARVARLQQLEG
jgi:hypothetical protein